MKILKHFETFLKIIGAPLGVVVFLFAKPVRGSLRSCSGEEGFGGVRQLPELFRDCGIITLSIILLMLL